MNETPTLIPYQIDRMKPSGKWYDQCDTIYAEQYGLYLVVDIIRKKYKEDLEEGYLFLIRNTTDPLGLPHIVK